ncbi:MAG: hypothetical protein ACOC93_02295 [Planctomycetota bacterium]
MAGGEYNQGMQGRKMATGQSAHAMAGAIWSAVLAGSICLCGQSLPHLWALVGLTLIGGGFCLFLLARIVPGPTAQAADLPARAGRTAYWCGYLLMAGGTAWTGTAMLVWPV